MNPLLIAAPLGSIVAAITTMMIVPLVRRVAMAVRAVDYPGGRRRQNRAVPRIGGVAIVAGIGLGVLIPMLVLWRQWHYDATTMELAVLAAGAFFIFLTGLADDLLGLTPIQRILVQMAVAASVVYGGWSFDRIYIPILGQIHLEFWGAVVTVLWIVGVTNAINLLDGLDGLAGGVAVIIATSFLIFAFIKENSLAVLLMAAVVGACLGFLRHNWAPAHIYMGDSGSLTLGFLLAVMSLHSSIKGAASVAILVPILALGLPVIDTLLVMAVRFVEKPQGPAVRRFARMFQADRKHFHHLLAYVAPERKQIVPIIYALATCFCAMSLMVALSRSAQLGIVLVMVETLVIFLIRRLGVRREARTLALEQRRQVREGFFARNQRLPMTPEATDAAKEFGYAKR